MSALSSQVAPTPQTEEFAALAVTAVYPEETRFVIDYRLKTVSPTAPRPNVLVRRRKRQTRRLVR